MQWRKMGRHLVADWEHGSMQIVRDDQQSQKSFKYVVFETGALIAQGKEPTLPAAKRKAESSIPGQCTP